MQRLLQCLYVEDIITGEGENDGGYYLHVKSNARLANGRFNVTIFISSFKNLICQINDNERLLKRCYKGTEIYTLDNYKTVVEDGSPDNLWKMKSSWV